MCVCPGVSAAWNHGPLVPHQLSQGTLACFLGCQMVAPWLSVLLSCMPVGSWQAIKVRNAAEQLSFQEGMAAINAHLDKRRDLVPIVLMKLNNGEFDTKEEIDVSDVIPPSYSRWRQISYEKYSDLLQVLEPVALSTILTAQFQVPEDRRRLAYYALGVKADDKLPNLRQFSALWQVAKARYESFGNMLSNFELSDNGKICWDEVSPPITPCCFADSCGPVFAACLCCQCYLPCQFGHFQWDGTTITHTMSGLSCTPPAGFHCDAESWHLDKNWDFHASSLCNAQTGITLAVKGLFMGAGVLLPALQALPFTAPLALPAPAADQGKVLPLADKPAPLTSPCKRPKTGVAASSGVPLPGAVFNSDLRVPLLLVLWQACLEEILLLR